MSVAVLLTCVCHGPGHVELGGHGLRLETLLLKVVIELAAVWGSLVHLAVALHRRSTTRCPIHLKNFIVLTL